MLSWEIDRVKGPDFGDVNTQTTTTNVVASVLAERIASIPFFVKTILLIEDDDVRQRVLSFSIFQRSILCHQTVDRWIVHMLKWRGRTARRVVDYFELVSKMTPRDFVGRNRTLRPSDYELFHSSRSSLILEAGKYQDIIPSLVVLPNEEIERAATTHIVHRMLDQAIARPFVASVILIDLVLHVLLMIVFRALAFSHGVISQIPGSENRFPSRDITTLIVITIGCHFILRKAIDGIAMILISWSVFYTYFCNLWNLIQIASIILVLWSSIHMYGPGMELVPNLFAVTMGFLWLSLLGFLKAINSQLSTYIMAVVQIIKDLVWFLVILIAVMFMFADMVHIIKTNTEGMCVNAPATGGENDSYSLNDNWSEDEFCTNKLIRSYIRVTLVLLGDFSLDEFNDTPFITILFIIFLMLLIVILLNVFIALVIESYEKSRVRSENLFGRSRVQFAAEHISLENYLRHHPRPKRCDDDKEGRSRTPRLFHWDDVRWFFGRLVRFFVLFSIIGSSGFANYTVILRLITLLELDDDFSVYQNTAFTFIITVLLTVVLAMPLLVIVNFMLKGYILPTNEKNTTLCRCLRLPKIRLLEVLQTYCSTCFRFVIRHIGINNPDRVDTRGEDGCDEWTGRLSHMEQVTNNIVAESELRIYDVIKKMEEKIMIDDVGIRAEFKADMKHLLSEILDVNSVHEREQSMGDFNVVMEEFD